MKTDKCRALGLVMAVLMLVPMVGNAALIHRSIDGVDLYYDDVLDITWLADTNLAASNTFGLTQNEREYPVDAVRDIGSTGRMLWGTANTWIAGMNAADYLGFDDWRLPSLSPISGGTTFTGIAFSNNATTDLGFAKTTTDGSDGGWRDGVGTPVSEMGHMYYVNLANLGLCAPSDGDPGSCVPQVGWGLRNTGSFSNLQPRIYWSGVEQGSRAAWIFRFDSGRQTYRDKAFFRFAWAVRSGDVAAQAVPTPGTLVLFGTGLLGLVGLGRARRR